MGVGQWSVLLLGLFLMLSLTNSSSGSSEEYTNLLTENKNEKSLH
jgi:hypothetical protein